MQIHKNMPFSRRQLNSCWHKEVVGDKNYYAQPTNNKQSGISPCAVLGSAKKAKMSILCTHIALNRREKFSETEQ